MATTRRLLAVSLLLVLLGSLAQAQTKDQFEARFGTPVDVSIDDLTQMPGMYRGRAVRTKGRVDISMAGGTRRQYLLRSTFGNGALIMPFNVVDQEWEQDAPTFIGQEVEITGVVEEAMQDPSLNSNVYIQFWAYVGPPEKNLKGPVANLVSLESLVGKPGRYDGQILRVVGKFRGRNLYGDLPVKSQRTTEDWVIKDDVYAVWVSGRKPKGSGFALDPGLKRDTGKWMEVTGRIESHGGVTYIRAVQVNLAAPPSAAAQAAPPAPPPAKPKVPPVVVFALPLDGEAEVPQNSQFTVQFSKDMEEATFNGHVLLRYVGPKLPGDRDFDGLKLVYDRGRRALTVDPGDLLRTGRQVELILLPGILDTDGLPLTPRSARSVNPEATDVLRYLVGG
jgi:hypothetical protein